MTPACILVLAAAVSFPTADASFEAVDVLAPASAQQSGATTVCGSLSHAHLTNTTIRIAEVIRGGSFTPPNGSDPIAGLPPFCRVAGEIHPTSDSHIGFEVWLPLEHWNGKLAAAGNAGWAGRIPFDYTGTAAGTLVRTAAVPFGFNLSDQIKRGYASVGTDTGHEMSADDPVGFALGHPERLIDFAYRAVHESTVAAKALVRAFYDKAPEHSYWIGQSTGGEQGFMEAERFPNDFDGMVVGTPSFNHTWASIREIEAYSVGVTTLDFAARTLLHDAVMAACDGSDGVVDGLINDPVRCTFDPASMRCPTGVVDARSCLSTAQVAAAAHIYDGVRDPMTAKTVAHGLMRGSELGWSNRFPVRGPVAPAISYQRNVIFGDPRWDWRTFDFRQPAVHDVIVERERAVHPILESDSPDLRAFQKRGGKILHFQGWSDPAAMPLVSTDYYDSVVKLYAKHQADLQPARREVQGFYRLFMIPGMIHGLGNGDGPATFDLLTALEDWKERGKAPDALVGTQFTAEGALSRTRPLCSYPLVAHYRGSGDVNQAANFSCSE